MNSMENYIKLVYVIAKITSIFVAVRVQSEFRHT